MSLPQVPFNKPYRAGKELLYIEESLQQGHISGDGHFTNRVQTWFTDQFRLASSLLTTSCTHALEMCSLLLELEPGDEVILPSFTFVSAANAVVLRGATPVFCDIRPDTLNLDETKLPALITPRTRAIFLVHYAGVACEMDAIQQIASQHGLLVVEDNAHGLFGHYKGRPLGTMGCLATQSFHETKNFTCGEGGALFINDPRFVERAEILREKGTDRSKFFRGQVDRYSWVDLGSSYVMSDMLAAFLWAQLEASQQIQAARCHLWKTYDEQLTSWCGANQVGRPVIPSHCAQAWHMYYLLLPSLEARTRLIVHLKSHGILAVFHYLPLHLSKFGLRYGGKAGDCPVTEDMSDRLLRLPFYNGMTRQEQTRVIEAITSFSL